LAPHFKFRFIYLYNILGWSSFPSIHPIIHPSKFLILKEEDDGGFHNVRRSQVPTSIQYYVYLLGSNKSMERLGSTMNKASSFSLSLGIQQSTFFFHFDEHSQYICPSSPPRTQHTILRFSHFKSLGVMYQLIFEIASKVTHYRL
jgi:hypothetical protein